MTDSTPERTQITFARPRLFLSLLSGLIGIVAVSCTQPAVVAPTNIAANTAEGAESAVSESAAASKRNADSTDSTTEVVAADSVGENAIANNSPSVSSPATFEESVMSGIEKHIGYGQARAILIANGWTPGINNTENSERYRLDGTIRELVDKGYREVQDCSGSGLGYCRFDFTYTGQGYPNQNGRGLSITTVYSQTAANGDPTLWDWGLSEPAASTPVASASNATPANSNGQTINTYANQPFSAEIFNPHIRESEGFCVGLAARCTRSEHAFEDVTLIAVPNEIGGTIITLIPKRRMTESTAQDYVAVLDTFNNIDFSQPSEDRVDPDQNLVKRYHGCPAMGEMGLSSSCFADISVTPRGTVSDIRFIQTYAGQ